MIQPSQTGRSPLSPLLLTAAGLGIIALLVALSPARWWLWSRAGWPLSIRQVQQVQSLRGQSVVVRGRVGDRAPLIGGQVYRLQDATGSLWVVSPNTSQQAGEAVTIRGIVQFEPIPPEILGQPAEAPTTAQPSAESGETYLEEQWVQVEAAP